MLNRLVSGLIAASLFSAPLVWAGHHEEKGYQRVVVTENISMLQGKGGNIGVLDGSDGLLMIDDDYPDMSEALKKTLVSYGGVDRVSHLINTHFHGDHTGGNDLIGQYAQILAHINVRQRLMSRQEVKLFGMVQEPRAEVALPDITYDRNMSLHINGEHVELVHYAGGHTDGDSVVYFHRANVVHTGDHFFNGFFPFVDVDNGGNVLAMAANVADILARIDTDTQVIPGHGPLARKQDLTDFHRMLLGTAAEVEAMKRAGKTLEQAQRHGLTAQWRPWTKGFLSEEVWIGLVYRSL